MENNVTISPFKPTNDALDFNYLKQLGIASIQKYSGKLWTDYNIHDPGITILEVLCFALTEMGYRCRYPLNDLMALQNAKSDKDFNHHHSDLVLFTNPLTELDFRKILLGINEVRNAYTSQDYSINDFQGIWKIKVEVTPNADIEAVKQKIREVLHEKRNLCEDFTDIDIVEYDEIAFSIDLEVKRNSNLKHLLLKIHQTIENYLNPSIKYYSLKELTDKGYSTDEIFVGPKPVSGFILEEELIQNQLREKIYTSDLYRLIMDIHEIDYIKRFRILDRNGKSHRWVCPVEKGKAATINLNKTEIKFFHLEKPVIQNFNLDNFFDKEVYQSVVKSQHKNLSHKIDFGEYRNVEEYESIQNELPEFYGVGSAGLSINSTKERIAQSKQLKAYLMIFDQLNANFLAQLEHLANLFSLRNINHTYYLQVLRDVPGMELIYVPFLQLCQINNINTNDKNKVNKLWQKEKENVFARLEENIEKINENEHQFINRRNKILDHLIARFAYTFTDFNLMDSNSTYENIQLINNKIEALKNIQVISSEKMRSHNLLKETNKDHIESGFHLGLQKFLGLNASLSSIPINWETSENEPENTTKYLKFYKVKKYEVPILLSRWGGDIENFIIIPSEEQFKIALKNNDEIIAEYSALFNSKQEAMNKAIKLAKQIDEDNQIFETVFYFEHILLRPPNNAKAFHFQFFDEQGNQVFSSSQPMTVSERSKCWKQILRFGQNPENYIITEAGYNQYQFELVNNHKTNIAKSNMYFHNKEQVTTMINSTINSIQKIVNGSIDVNKHLNEFTEVIRPDYKIKDIYSNIITYVIPDWPARFQEEHKKSWIEKKLMEFTPAHLFANIRWMDYNQLITTVMGYYNILEKKQQADIDAEEIYNLQKELFKNLI